MKTKEMLAHLLDILGRQTELYQAMSTVMSKEKDAAVQSELIALNEAEIEKENILVALGLLEGQRCDLVTGLAKTLGCDDREMNLTTISRLVGDPYAAQLQRARSDLLQLLESVQAANQRNKQLFEHSRELLRSSFNLLSELGAPNPIYHRSGAVQNTCVSGKCVCDEI